MNLKTTIALLLLAGCAVGAVVVRGRLPWPAPPAPEAKYQGPQLSPGDLRKVEIHRPKPQDDKAKVAALALLGQKGIGALAAGQLADVKTDVVRLERAGDVWVMPGNWPTRAAEVERLLALLTRHGSRFEPIDPDLAAHGTDAPTITAHVETKGGTKHVLKFSDQGDGPAFDRPTYLRIDDGKVLRLSPGVVAALDRPAEHYLQRRLFPTARAAKEDEARERVDRLAARRVEVEQVNVDVVADQKEPTRKTTGYAVARAGDDWELAQPSRDALDPEARDKLLEGVADLWAEKFVEGDDAKDEKTGLKEGTQSVVLRRVSVTRDDGRVVTLHVGKQIPEAGPPGPDQKPRYYARLDGSERVFEVNGDKFEGVFVSADRLRDKRLARFEPDDAREVELTTARGTVVLRNKKPARPGDDKSPPAEWVVSKPAETKADAAAVGKLLSALSSAQALDADVAEQAKWAGVVGVMTLPRLSSLTTAALLTPAGDFGLTKPAATVRVTVEQSKRDTTAKKARTFTLRFGRHDAEGKRLFATSQDWPRVNALGDELAELVLDKSALDFRDKRALDFAPADVRRLSVRRSNEAEIVTAAVGLLTATPANRLAFGPSALADPADVLTLQRTAGGWALASPVSAPADASKVDALAEQLGKLEVMAWAAPEPGHGLASPRTTVTVEYEGDRKPATALSIGRPRDGMAGHYARLGDAPEAFVVPEGLVAQLERDSLSYRPASLWQASAGDVAKVRIERKGQAEYALENKGGEWEVSGPFSVKAPKAVIDRLAGSLASPAATNYVAHAPKDYAGYGLATPEVKVTLTTRQGQEHSLWLGDRTGGGRFARLGGKGDAVFVVPEGLARAADQSALDFLDRELLRFDPEAAVSYERVKAGEAMKLEKVDSAWKLTAPAERAADDEKVPALLKALAGLRAERIAAYAPKDEKKYGLDKPETTVKVKLSPEAKGAEYEVEVGGEVEGLPGARYARVKGKPAVAELSAEAVRRLSAGPLAYRDHQVARLAGAEVAKLEAGERKATFAQPDGTWKMTAPVASEADHDAMQDFVRGLARLRADEFVADKATAEQLKAFGLDKPARRWQFGTDDETKMDLLVGATEKDGPRRYAKLANGDAVFLMDAKLSERAAAEYRPRRVFDEPIDPARVEGLKFGHKDGAFEMRKGEAGWSVVGKPELKVDEKEVTRTLAALRELKLERYVLDDKAKLTLYGLDPAEMTLEVTTEQGKQSLLLGGLEGTSRRRYARRPGGKAADVFVLDEAASAALFRELGGLTGKR